MKTHFFDHYNSLWHQNLQSDLGSTKETFGQVLNNLWQKWLEFITTTNDQPHIWMSHNALGEVAWNAYDPISGRRLAQATESEMMVWLEQRYNCR